MKKIRKFVARMTQPKSEREKQKSAEFKDQKSKKEDTASSDPVEDTASSDLVQDPTNGRRRHRSRSRSRCTSHHSVVLGSDGFPTAPQHCSAREDEGQKPPASTGSQSSIKEADWLNVTLPYPFSISTIMERAIQLVSGDMQEGGADGPYNPLEPVAGPSGVHRARECIPTCAPPNSCRSFDSLLEGRTTSADDKIGFMGYSPFFHGRPSKYEKLMSSYWVERDLTGKSTLERWIDVQVDETQQRKERKAKERKDRKDKARALRLLDRQVRPECEPR